MTAYKTTLPLLFLLYSACLVLSAPATCRSCKGACHQNNGTNVSNDGVIDFDTGAGNRTKRESFIEQRSCSTRFQLEMILIPLSIAIIPVGLCALLVCVCFCGPKDSRGKLPDNFLGKKISRDYGEDKDSELEYKDGCIQRKDSKKTRFSTNVAIIEARRISMDLVEGSSVESYDPLAASPVVEETDPTEVGHERQSSKKRTRFNNNVSIMGQEKAGEDASGNKAETERQMSEKGTAKKSSWLGKLGRSQSRSKDQEEAKEGEQNEEQTTNATPEQTYSS
ncbi:hypothetical protein L596_002637 [Steinernema carpocapsae]|uniref:Uncharacterized protein n=1 Tax=Steinernema carpocapsae TaxID=34508 RepID=A0A4U8URN3_STECR|nr:hypothetical protein L596_002637 [Steinernema carpocapsae]